MKNNFEKLTIVLMMFLLLLTGCDDKQNEIPNDDVNSDITDTDNKDDNVSEENTTDKIWLANLTGYFANDEYKDRYYGFTNKPTEIVRKEFNLNGTVYKFDVEMKNVNNVLEYKIYLNDKLLDTISYTPDYQENKNIDLFLLDGYAVIGYNRSYVKVYGLDSYDIVENFRIVRDGTSIENKFVLTANSLSFVDISNCEPKKLTIEVNSKNIKLSRTAMTEEEIRQYQIAGAAC